MLQTVMSGRVTYLPSVKPFWEQHEVPIIEVHTSGHAYIKELTEFVTAMKPKYIIPNHTFYPEKYREHFGDNILMVNDSTSVELT